MVWEVTPEKAVVKITKWSKVRDLSPQHMEDPIKEVAAMQYLCTRTQGGSPNIVGTLDVLSDEKYLYSFMPFCSGGDLFGYVKRNGRISEPLARSWFRQLLNVSWFHSFSWLCLFLPLFPSKLNMEVLNHPWVMHSGSCGLPAPPQPNDKW